MATDSTMAKPTNNVRVMVAEASGCCASALNAVESARPSPSAGPMLPMAIVRPDAKIDATAIMVMLSMVFPFVVSVHFAFAASDSGLGLLLRVAAAMYTVARMLKM